MAISLSPRVTAASRAWRPALVAMAIYLLLCIVKSGPGLLTGHTWANWADQQHYLRSTWAFARGDLSPGSHWYPLVYPLLATPFLALMPGNPYLLLDTLCFGLMAQAVTRVAERFGIGWRLALVVTVAVNAWPMPLWHAWVQPWTTTLSAALIWWLMAWVGDVMVGREQIAPRRAAAIGAVAMLVPLTRPADLGVAVVLVAAPAVVLAARRRLAWRSGAAAIGGALAVLLPYAALHVAIYGPQATDYMRLSAAIGVNFGDLGWKAVVLYLDPHPWFPGDKGLIEAMPWLVLGLIGYGIALWRQPPAHRGLLAVLLAAALANLIVLTAYIDFLPSGLWRFNNVHYLKWMLPLFGLTAVLTVRNGWRHRGVMIVATLGVVALTGLRFDAVPAAPGQPARRIDLVAPAYAAAPDKAMWARINFARSAVAGAGFADRNIFDYRQIAVAGQIRAIALRRPFAPDAGWWPGGLAGLDWPPGNSSGAALAGPPRQPPIARWDAALHWGVPRWLGGCRGADGSPSR